MRRAGWDGKGAAGWHLLGEDCFTLNDRGLPQGDVLNVSLDFQKAVGGPDYSCPSLSVYFFEGEEGISLDEACRFLCHRRREKLRNAQKKGNTPDDSAAPVGGNESDGGKQSSPKTAG